MIFRQTRPGVGQRHVRSRHDLVAKAKWNILWITLWSGSGAGLVKCAVVPRGGTAAENAIPLQEFLPSP